MSWAGFELTQCVVIFTDCLGSNKSNYHAITTMVGVFHVKYCLQGDRYFSINIEYQVLV